MVGKLECPYNPESSSQVGEGGYLIKFKTMKHRPELLEANTFQSGDSFCSLLRILKDGNVKTIVISF